MNCAEEDFKTHTQIEENIRRQVREDATLLGMNNLLIKDVKAEKGLRKIIISRTGIIQSWHKYYIVRRNLASDSLKCLLHNREQHFRFFEISGNSPFVFWNFDSGKMAFWIQADLGKYFQLNLDNNHNEFDQIVTFITSKDLRLGVDDFFLTAKTSFDVPDFTKAQFAIQRRNSMIKHESTLTPNYSRRTSQETKSSTPRSSQRPTLILTESPSTVPSLVPTLSEENKSFRSSYKYLHMDAKNKEKHVDEENCQQNYRKSLSKERDSVNLPLNEGFDNLYNIDKIQFFIATPNISAPPGFEELIQNSILSIFKKNHIQLMSQNEVYENQNVSSQNGFTARKFEDKYPVLEFLKEQDSEFAKLFQNSSEDPVLRDEKYLIWKRIFNLN